MVTLGYPGGAQAIASVTLRAPIRSGASIAGTEARIDVNPLFISPNGFALVSGDERLEFDGRDEFWRAGLAWQATAVATHVAAGRTEAPEHPLDRSISVLETIDAARTQLGYPPRH